MRNASNNNYNVRQKHRLSLTKKLPTFSGDLLDWFRFKQAFEYSIDIGEYGDRENCIRLFEALSGEAG